MNEVVFDSSAIISIAETCLMHVLGELSQRAKGNFFISEGVEFESVIHPLRIKRFELNAIRIKQAIDENWLKVFRDKNKINSLAGEIESKANQIFFSSGKPLKLIQLGEIESIALVKALNARHLVIDERTARMLLEEPMELKKILDFEYSKKTYFNKSNWNDFASFVGEIKIVRSTELMALAFEKQLFERELKQSRQALEATLYALKFSGCAISLNEIQNYLRKK